MQSQLLDELYADYILEDKANALKAMQQGRQLVEENKSLHRELAEAQEKANILEDKANALKVAAERVAFVEGWLREEPVGSFVETDHPPYVDELLNAIRSLKSN